MSRLSLWAGALLLACAAPKPPVPPAPGPGWEPDSPPTAISDGQASTEAKGEPAYFPTRWSWESRPPAELGFDAAKLDDAVTYAKSHDGTDGERDLRVFLDRTFGKEPRFEIIGPVEPRGDPGGLVVRHGYIAAEWGDTRRVDMTFSVTKSYLATVAGLALDAGLIRDIDDPVRTYVTDGTFDDPHNRPITWRHLLNQTSEWQGTLWGKHDWADRSDGKTRRKVHEPGTSYLYNDVRVNVLAYALLQVWRQPLPRVLKERVMDPIGASSTWRWHGYRNSTVTIDGLPMESVSGGGHWGGGMFISARDHARFGYLHLRGGAWDGKELLSSTWLDVIRQPTPVKPTYGAMWWLNTGRELYPSAPATSFFALGAGSNLVWVDPDHDMVVVIRWIDRKHIDALLDRFLAAIEDGG